MTTSVNIELYKSQKHKYDKLFVSILQHFIDKTNNKLYVHSKDSRFYITSMTVNHPVLLRIPVTLIKQKIWKIGDILR